jgi:hypothetical protein
MLRPMRHRLLALGALAGCHGMIQSETTRPGAVTRRHVGAPTVAAPTVVLTDDGTLRFVEPLRCAVEERVALETTTDLTTTPNLATVAVGVIATSLGAIAGVTGWLGADPGGDPLSYAGPLAIAVGAPMAIGPFLGLGHELRRGAPGALRRAAGEEPCGDRPFAATAATLTIRGREIHGAIAADGTFAVSPFALVDAFAAAATPAWDVTAHVETAAGPRSFDAVITPAALAAAAPAFLRRADFDPTINPIRLVPTIVAGALVVRLTATGDGPALRVILPLHNDGPGEACAVRAALVSREPAIDGRVLYVGHLAPGEDARRELVIPITAAATARLTAGTLDLAAELRDAHGTAPADPVRFRGVVTAEPPEPDVGSPR